LRHGSSRNTWLAAVRLMPTAPLRTLSRNTAAAAGAAGAAEGVARLRHPQWMQQKQQICQQRYVLNCVWIPVPCHMGGMHTTPAAAAKSLPRACQAQKRGQTDANTST
jgi:hypothetical protein